MTTTLTDHVPAIEHVHLDRQALRALVDPPGGPVVSIYLPMDRAGTQVREATARLYGLLDEAEASLEAFAVPPKEVGAFTVALRALAADPRALTGRGPGVAFFLERGRTRAFDLLVAPADHARVGLRFHVGPLLPALDAAEARFHVLAIGGYEARLIEVHGETPGESVDLEPDEFQHTRGEQRASMLNVRSGPQGGALFHGHGGAKELEGQALHARCRALDRALAAALPDAQAKVVLATVERTGAIFRQESRHVGLVAEEIAGNPEGSSVADLARRAAAVVGRRRHERALATARAVYADAARGRGTDDAAKACQAALEGRVETVVVAQGKPCPGVLGPGATEARHGERGPLEDRVDLADVAVAETIRHGGEAISLAPGDMPEGATVLARTRF